MSCLAINACQKNAAFIFSAWTGQSQAVRHWSNHAQCQVRHVGLAASSIRFLYSSSSYQTRRRTIATTVSTVQKLGSKHRMRQYELLRLTHLVCNTWLETPNNRLVRLDSGCYGSRMLRVPFVSWLLPFSSALRRQLDFVLAVPAKTWQKLWVQNILIYWFACILFHFTIYPVD